MTTTTASASVTLIAKWGKERVELHSLSPQMSIGEVKCLLQERTGVLPKRQKLIGLTLSKQSNGINNGGKITDEVLLSSLEANKGAGKKGGVSGAETTNIVVHSFLLMGTTEERIFVDPGEKDDLPDVVDDFELDFNAGSDEWLQHVANGDNLQRFTEQTQLFVMNEPRPNKPLLVLDLDHTLLDFSSRRIQRAMSHAEGNQHANEMKRPYMDEFLTSVYRHYDLAVWSQTSWRWLETKLIELGMLTHLGYKFCFVMDKTSMFAVTSTKRDGTRVQHHVKPLQIIWSKFPERWGSHNTIHLDDLSRNFALNLGSGLKVSPYHRKKNGSARTTDCELLGLAKYLEQLATKVTNFEEVDFRYWMDVLNGKRALLSEEETMGTAGRKKRSGKK